MKTIKPLTVAGITLVGLFIPTISMASDDDTTISGTVEQVWEDGFNLNTGDSTHRVDSWDVYGDNTPDNIAVGDRLMVTGEFDDGEFDADSISN